MSLASGYSFSLSVYLCVARSASFAAASTPASKSSSTTARIGAAVGVCTLKSFHSTSIISVNSNPLFCTYFVLLIKMQSLPL